MFSKSLFKQSCKANGTMWAIITFAVCFTLACVMLIAGGSDLASTKNAIQNTIIEGELTSQMQRRALNYYILSDNALVEFDNKLKEESLKAQNQIDPEAIYNETYNIAISTGKTPEEAQIIALKAMTDAAKIASVTAYKNSVEYLKNTYIPAILNEKNILPESSEAQEITGAIFMVLNPMTTSGDYMFDSFYHEINEEPPRYNINEINSMTESERKIYRDNYSAKYSSCFLAGNIIKSENVDAILDELSKYGVTHEQYNEFGFNNYSKVKNIAESALVNFRANLVHRLENIKDGETEETIVKELTKDISESLLASLPRAVSEALDEIGQADLYGILVGSIFYKMAGLLLPIIYLIMTANSLIAGQVDSGSMAYILSSSIKRRTVVFTQALFLVGSLFTMFCCSTITSLICLSIVNVETKLTFGKLILMNLGAFIVLFAMSGICFLASCWFNRSKHSMAIGGGINMFFLVATMLGLFGSQILPSIIRMEALNMFNYVSLISLFDVISILDGGLSFIWKLGILVVFGIICYIIASEKFVKKDLPL